MTTESEPHDRPNRPDPVARTLEVVVYAPIGAAAFLREMGPGLVRTVVARGRAEVNVRQEQVASRLRHAKGAGEVAMAFGLPLLRQKVSARLSSLRPAAEPAPRAEAEPPRPAAAAAPVVPVASDEPLTTVMPAGSNGHRAPDPAPLAIPGYDALSASQVVERLAGLSRDELDAVRHYEAGRRRRRTILGKIEQLSA